MVSLTPAEHALLSRASWTVDELLTLAFALRRVVRAAAPLRPSEQAGGRL